MFSSLRQGENAAAFPAGNRRKAFSRGRRAHTQHSEPGGTCFSVGKGGICSPCIWARPECFCWCSGRGGVGFLSCGRRPGRRDLLQREGRAQPPDGNFPSPGLSWGLSCGVNFPAGRCGLSISCLGGVSPGAECVCRNNLPDFGAPPAGGMTQKLGKSPSLRPCGTGRTFFLSGAVGDPPEHVLRSGQRTGAVTCILLFFPVVPHGSAEGQGLWSFSRKGVPGRAFLRGENREKL